MIQVIVLILVVGAVLWVLLTLIRGGGVSRKQDAALPEPAAEQAGSGSRFPGVSIRTYRKGCPPAEALKGQRYSPEDAPPLPLPNCTWDRCHCTYSHHVDRRTGNLDRRKMLGSQKEYPMSMGEDDQRGGRGRRIRDPLNEFETPPGED